MGNCLKYFSFPRVCITTNPTSNDLLVDLVDLLGLMVLD